MIKVNANTYIQYGKVASVVLGRLGILNSFVMGLKFLVVRLQFKLRMIKPFMTPPNYYLFVTKRCNLTCSFCHYHDELDKPKSIEESWEWTLDDLIKFESEGVLKKRSKVCLYGGEPMLNQDFFPMVQYLNTNGYLSSTITNATLVTQYIDQLLANPLHQITVSYYKGIADKHVEALKKVASKSILNISYIMTESQYHKVEEVILLSIHIGAKFITLENLIEKESCKQKSVCENEDYKRFKADMIAKYSSKIIMRWGEVGKVHKSSKQKIHCSEPWDMILLDKQGRVLPCCQYPLSSFESAKKEENAFWSETLQEIRKKMKKNIVPEKCEGCYYLYAKDPLYNFKG